MTKEIKTYEQYVEAMTPLFPQEPKDNPLNEGLLDSIKELSQSVKDQVTDAAEEISKILVKRVMAGLLDAGYSISEHDLVDYLTPDLEARVNNMVSGVVGGAFSAELPAGWAEIIQRGDMALTAILAESDKMFSAHNENLIAMDKSGEPDTGERAEIMAHRDAYEILCKATANAGNWVRVSAQQYQEKLRQMMLDLTKAKENASKH